MEGVFKYRFKRALVPDRAGGSPPARIPAGADLLKAMESPLIPGGWEVAGRPLTMLLCGGIQELPCMKTWIS